MLRTLLTPRQNVFKVSSRGFARVKRTSRRDTETVPPPASTELVSQDPWTAVTDKNTGQIYWWNKQTNETTVVGAPKPSTMTLAEQQQQQTVMYQQPTLGQTMKEGVAWGVGMGVGRAIVGSVFNAFGGDDAPPGPEGGDDGDGWV